MNVLSFALHLRHLESETKQALKDLEKVQSIREFAALCQTLPQRKPPRLVVRSGGSSLVRL